MHGMPALPPSLSHTQTPPVLVMSSPLLSSTVSFSLSECLSSLVHPPHLSPPSLCACPLFSPSLPLLSLVPPPPHLSRCGRPLTPAHRALTVTLPCIQLRDHGRRDDVADAGVHRRADLRPAASTSFLTPSHAVLCSQIAPPPHAACAALCGSARAYRGQCVLIDWCNTCKSDGVPDSGCPRPTTSTPPSCRCSAAGTSSRRRT